MLWMLLLPAACIGVRAAAECTWGSCDEPPINFPSSAVAKGRPTFFCTALLAVPAGCAMPRSEGC